MRIGPTAEMTAKSHGRTTGKPACELTRTAEFHAPRAVASVAKGAVCIVPATKAERPVSVQLADSRRDARQWARRADSDRSPTPLIVPIGSLWWPVSNKV